ncbi:MAG TPA: DinB family protein [Chthonomonadaceae bacterium]|nr:DinB family protein [Chthonomonadaceae bacterium]
MPENFIAFVKQRSERSFRNLLQELEGLTPEEALRDHHPRWPGQQWGIGQDGSIAGIIYHVAAWKTLTLPLLQPGGQAIPQAQFNAASVPAPDDWPGLIAWLTQIGTEFQAALTQLPESAFEETRAWEGMTLPLWKIVVEMYEHDIQHAAQVAYLRQRNAAQWAAGQGL